MLHGSNEEITSFLTPSGLSQRLRYHRQTAESAAPVDILLKNQSRAGHLALLTFSLRQATSA